MPFYKYDNVINFKLFSMQGYLWMQRRRCWNFPSEKMEKFYFDLREDRLYYVEKEGDLINPESTNKIVLTLDTIIDKRHDENKEHYITLRISRTEKCKLKMENEEECTKWYDAINEALKNLQITAKAKQNVSRFFFHWFSVFDKKKAN